MTLEDLQQKSLGVLAIRKLTINGTYERKYYLVKKEDEYLVTFSDTGEYYSHSVCEETMVEYMNDKELSDSAAFALYIETPQLSSWLHD